MSARRKAEHPRKVALDVRPLLTELIALAAAGEGQAARATVVCSLAYPDWVAHHASDRCAVEYPHLIADCGEFDHAPAASAPIEPTQTAPRGAGETNE